MFEYINSIFAWGTVPDQKFILVSDSFTADASFLLQHFIGMFAKNKQHLCIVGAENSFFHYFSVARKLGVNLKALHADSKFSFVNAISNPYTWTDDVFNESSNTNTSALHTIANSHPVKFDSSSPLRKLFDTIAKQVAMAQKTSQSICVVLDNLNIIQMASSTLEAVEFVQQLHSLVESCVNPSCLVGLIHSDATDSSFLRALFHRADLVAQVSGFKTGSFKDIDGQLRFVQSRTMLSTEPAIPDLVYKVLDNTVRFDTIRKDVL